MAISKKIAARSLIDRAAHCQRTKCETLHCMCQANYAKHTADDICACMRGHADCGTKKLMGSIELCMFAMEFSDDAAINAEACLQLSRSLQPGKMFNSPPLQEKK
jgi:hypothetical protein